MQTLSALRSRWTSCSSWIASSAIRLWRASAHQWAQSSKTLRKVVPSRSSGSSVAQWSTVTPASKVWTSAARSAAPRSKRTTSGTGLMPWPTRRARMRHSRSVHSLKSPAAVARKRLV